MGKPATVAQALDLVTAAGRVLLLGLISDPIAIPGNVMVKKELDFLGSRLHGGTISQALKLLSERALDPSPLVSHRLGLADVPAMFALMASDPDRVLKPVVAC